MAIQANQIGNDPQSKLLWQISKQLEQLIGVTSNAIVVPPSDQFNYIATGGDSGIIIVENNPLYYSRNSTGNVKGVFLNNQYCNFAQGTCTYLYLPDITYYQEVVIQYYSNLETLILPNLISSVTDSGITIDNCPALVNLTIGTPGVIKEINSIDCQGAALSEDSVNGILAMLVGLDGTNGTTLFEQGLVALGGGTSASPTGQGILDAATLIARGVTVSLN